MEDNFSQTFSSNMLMAQTVFGPGGSLPPADGAPDPNDGNSKRPPAGAEPAAAAADGIGGRSAKPRRSTSDEALETLFWQEVPQHLWDRIVQKRGIPGILDSAGFATLALDAALRDPRVHKHVDVTRDGLRRFFEALDTNFDGSIQVAELHEGFQRTLNDFGLWDDNSPEFQAFWEETWQLMLEELASLRRPLDEESGTGDGPAPADAVGEIDRGAVAVAEAEAEAEEQTPFCFEAFSGLLRRLKLELALRALDEKGTKDCPLPMLKSIVKIDIDRPGQGQGQGRRSSIQLEEEEVVLKTYMWNARDVHGMDVTRRHMREFFLTSRAPQWAMRWIIADSADRANIVRLAVKYRFHPLHLEDVLKLDRQQPRFLRYGGHYLIILPLLRLIPDEQGNRTAAVEGEEDGRSSYAQPRASQAQQQQAAAAQQPLPSSQQQQQRVQHAGIHMEKSRVAIFAAGPPNFDTIISIHGAWRVVRNRCAVRRGHGGGSGTGGDGDGEGGGGGGGSQVKKGTWELTAAANNEGTHDTFLTPSVALPVEGEHRRSLSASSKAQSEDMILTGATNLDEAAAADAPSSVLTAAAALLHEDYSSVRQGNSNWMLHAMIETTAKMLAPIVAAYDRRLRTFQKQLDGPDSLRMRERLSKPIMDMKHDLIWLQKRVKSLKPVTRSLISERFMGDEVIFYIQGVDDELDILFDDITTMLTLTQGLLDEAKYIRDDTRNESLKLFAIVTTTLAPLQLLAGYYGMNFVNSEGESTIPLMNNPHGPLYFWIACIVLGGGFLAYCRFSRQWI